MICLLEMTRITYFIAKCNKKKEEYLTREKRIGLIKKDWFRNQLDSEGLFHPLLNLSCKPK